MAKPTHAATRQDPDWPGAPAPPTAGRPGWVVPVVLVAVVVALLVTALVVSQAGGQDEAGPAAAPAARLVETQPVVVTGTPLSVLSAASPDPAVGLVAPTLAGTTADGAPVRVGGTGRPTVVLFVAHWCPHCQREVPLLAPELGRITPPGVDVVAVSTSVRQGAANYPPSAWLKKEAWPLPVLADDKAGRAAQAYGLSGFPYYVVLDAEGKVVARDSGEKTLPQFEALLRQAAPAS